MLYILGRGRGGSTILGNVLGELEGFFSAGEVRTLWDPIVVAGGRCGCGRAATHCEVWSSVIEGVDSQEAARLQRRVVREQNLLTSGRKKSSGVTAFAEIMGEVYAKLAAVTGARVIVDTSKRPSYGAFLQSVPGICPRYLHLVRDPRASAHSWKQKRHESATPGAEVTRRGALDSTLRWDLLNLEAEWLRRSQSSESFKRLRYEDWVADPLAVTLDLADFAGATVEPTAFESNHTVRMGVNHTIAGNPSRYATGVVSIRDSGEWKRSQSRTDCWIATAVAAPLLPRYGYPFRVR